MNTLFRDTLLVILELHGDVAILKQVCTYWYQSLSHTPTPILHVQNYVSSVGLIQWARTNGSAEQGHSPCLWDESTCAHAAKGGHLEVLQWLRENGCLWDEYTCSGADRGGHLEVLQWARAHGCPWNQHTCAYAAYGGHMEVLQWAREHGCSWDGWTCILEEQGGQLEIRQWAREHGCPEWVALR